MVTKRITRKKAKGEKERGMRNGSKKGERKR
jgi:hypothetical protein